MTLFQSSEGGRDGGERSVFSIYLMISSLEKTPKHKESQNEEASFSE